MCAASRRLRRRCCLLAGAVRGVAMMEEPRAVSWATALPTSPSRGKGDDRCPP
eukprot:gene42294-29675_t